MARRKGLVLGRATAEWFSEALGYVTQKDLRKYLIESGEIPELNTSIVGEFRQDLLDDNLGNELKISFSLLVADEIVRTLGEESKSKSAVPNWPSETVTSQDFSSLVRRLQVKASELTDLIDALVAIDPGLACRPRNNGIDKLGLGARNSIDKMIGSNAPWHIIEGEDFADYYAFRKALDYFSHFEDCNKLYSENNLLAPRFTKEIDYTSFEFLVRRVVVSLREAGFPMTLTVPTDVNPEYQSPIIAVLLDLQEQFISAVNVLSADTRPRKPRLQYRQLLYLTSGIISDCERWEALIAEIAFRRQ